MSTTKSIDNILQSKDGHGIKHSHEGSLGLLALGDVGLNLWRQFKIQYSKAKMNVERHSNNENEN